MFKTLIEKELKNIVLSPKFAATFAVCSILLLLSVFIGVREYKQFVNQYDAAKKLSDQQMQEQTNWRSLQTVSFREPDPMQIFVSGINYDIGRFSGISSHDPIKLVHSIYSDDPIFAVFRFIDFTFIVQVVLSLIAILFTYDAVNGEREDGTLKLVFANAVPRAKYILAKIIGSWLGLVIPLIVPVLLSILIVVVFKVPLTGDHWIKLAFLWGVSLLYFTFFIAFSILISSLTKRSAVSFLVSLVTWILFVLIIPRAGVMTAGQIFPTPTVAVIESQIDGFSKDRWNSHMEELSKRWRARSVEMEGMTKAEREAYRDDKLWDWTEEDDASRKSINKDIDEFSRKLKEDLRNRKAVQEKLAFTLSRFSPASAYQLTVMNLAGTDHKQKSRYEDAMQKYRTTFIDYIEKKQKEAGGGGGGIRITMDSEKGFSFQIAKDAASLELGDVPKFQPPKRGLEDILSVTITDIGLLILYIIAAFSGAFVAFLRYDVR